jgi:hypothetical protein
MWLVTDRDDDPTLETVSPDSDEEPTLETVAPRTSGWASRLERMTAAGRERRRKLVTRFWLTAIPVVLLLVIAVVLLSVFGGLRGGRSSVSTTTTAARQSVAGSGLLLVTQDQALSLAILLQPWDTGGVVLAVPGIVLLVGGGAFDTLTGMYEKGQADAVAAALREALDVPAGPVAVVEWSDFAAAMTAAGVAGVPAGALRSVAEEAEILAQAARGFIGEYASDAGAGLWNGLRMEGEKAEFLRAVGLEAATMAADVWTAYGLTGTVITGEGFTYLEPDVEAAKALLEASAQTATVSVAVKDGAGLAGAATRAGDMLEVGGYALLPMSYAEGYPGVERTLIEVPPGDIEEAQKVLALLGVGEVLEDASVAADQVVVVLGKDFIADSPPGT